MVQVQTVSGTQANDRSSYELFNSTQEVIVLLCNDDGIGAEGLAALRRAASRAFPTAELVTVAPAGAMSMVGHRVTTHEPLSVQRQGPSEWAVEGTPADCVRVALAHILKDQRPHWVLSGINHGGNMGQDIYISGTVAAAREAAYHGIPAAAFSHYLKRDLKVCWDRAGDWVASVLATMESQGCPAGELWNVNLPHLGPGAGIPPVLDASPEIAPLPVAFLEGPQGLHYAGVYADRPRAVGSDVDVCFQGNISRSRIRI
ncbi:MAG: 5'-nucleotidase [Verrucomicrobia bacterium]|jgi:5'-nucleotidase|nr:MAG: 5'-nucleotidase [Verrucomicrobiota bacterium]